MTTPLTALERDLLACVERLVTACEVSAKELSGLEERSTNGMQSRMDGLAACVSVLIQSQVASVDALNGLLSEGQSYGRLADFARIKYGTLKECGADLGGMEAVISAFVGFQRHLYRPSN